MPARVPAGLEGWPDLPPLSIVILSFYNCFSLSIVILSFFCVVILSFYNCCGLSIVIFWHRHFTTAVVRPLSFSRTVIWQLLWFVHCHFFALSFCHFTTAVVCPMTFCHFFVLSLYNCCSLSIVILSFFRVVILSFYNCCGLSIVIFSSPKFFVPKGSLPKVYPDCQTCFSACVP